MTVRPFPIPFVRLATTLALACSSPGSRRPMTSSRQCRSEAIAHKGDKVSRAYHFGSQGPGDVFSNHTSHTNRLIPIYTFGRKVDLGSVTGANSLYRDPAKVKALYGFLPERTVNPEAEYADQSDLYRVQKDAVARGVKHLFIVWFDGMDWDTTRAAAIAKIGQGLQRRQGVGPGVPG